MMLEVERKFCLADVSGFRERAEALGLAFGEPESQVDTYYRHPARDFGATDEALRIRRGSKGCSLTYKGPKTDASSKTRTELDIVLDPIDPQGEHFDQLLDTLGFRELFDVKKTRQTAKLEHEDRSFSVCLDQTDGLGWFVELETLAAPADQDAALAALDSLASQLELADDERRSYLELLLQE